MSEEAHEWRCPNCEATTRARMADHPPGGEELREAMLRALCVDHGHSRQEGGMNCRTCQRRVATLLALPAVRDALAAQEKLRRVRVVADELRGITGAGSWRYSDAASQIRRALDGDS